MLGQVWEGCLRVLAGYNMVPWRGQPRPPGRVRTYTTATLPPPHPARSAPDRCVHGPSPCGELPKGWESLIYPFNTHLWSVEVCTCPIPPHLTPSPPLEVGAYLNGYIRPWRGLRWVLAVPLTTKHLGWMAYPSVAPVHRIKVRICGVSALPQNVVFLTKKTPCITVHLTALNGHQAPHHRYCGVSAQGRSCGDRFDGLWG